MEGAAAEYAKADDHLSLCRIACFSMGIEAAQQICTDSGSKSACYHLARHLEAEGNSKGAIHFYSLSGRVGHALRLAQQSSLDNELMHLALGCGDPTSMMQAGRYCEQTGQLQKAVTLYHKAGSSTSCARSRGHPPRGLRRPGDPRAVCGVLHAARAAREGRLPLGISKQYETAVDLCFQHDVPVTEEMIERMTPDKAAMEGEKRTALLHQLAKLCKNHGKFQLACKKYTQAGDKLKAMKALLRSGDTEKVIFFAGTARQPEVYVLAANYLQSLDWHADADVMKNIILFYTKAKDFEKLGTFYETVAQTEIDEYRDYEKAAGALREASKYFKKEVKGEPVDAERVEKLKVRIKYVDTFAACRKMEGQAMIAGCEELLADPSCEGAVRVGDIFALMVEYHVSQSDFAWRTSAWSACSSCGSTSSPTSTGPSWSRSTARSGSPSLVRPRTRWTRRSRRRSSSTTMAASEVFVQLKI